jgi:hypothetical protein
MANVETLEEGIDTITGNREKKEGKVARFIEQAAKFPSDIFLWASVSSILTSLTLKILKKDHMSLFVGQWAAPFLVMGVYNKLVKLEGHDKTDY